MNTIGDEFIPPKMPTRKNAPPLVRDLTGPQVYTHGVIAKQPGSGWRHRLLDIERKQIEDAQKIAEAQAKDIQKGRLVKQFNYLTEKRNVKTRIHIRVQNALLAKDEELQDRREKLKKLLLIEETSYTEEYIKKAQNIELSKFEDIQRSLLEMKLKQEAERKALVEEKRLQQFRDRCDELRTTVYDHNRRMLSHVHELQMKDKLALEESEKERDCLYYKIIQKDVEAMKEYEDKVEKARQQRLCEMADVYKKQLEGKCFLEEEEKRIKLEEAKLIEQLNEELKREKQEEKEKENETRERLRKEMEEQLQQSKEILEWRRKQEKEMDNAFCRLVQSELDKERAAITDSRRQMRKELEHFQEHLDEMRKEREEAEKTADELRKREVERIDKEKCRLKLLAENKKEELRLEVLRERAIQVEENKKRANEELEKKRNEERWLMVQFEQNAEFEKEEKRQAALHKKKYAKELKEQQELIRIAQEKEKQADERRLTEERMAEEQYLRKAEKMFDKRCPKQHPFTSRIMFSSTTP